MKKSLSDVTIKNADLGEIEAVFSRFDVIDKDGDVTRKGAFAEGAPVVISAYNHTSWDGALPVGKGTIHEDGDVAVMKGQFFLTTTHGRDAWETVKELSKAGLQEWSYSLHNIDAEPGTVDGKQVRIIKSVGVKEVSPVLLGAGVDTGTRSTKAHTFSEHAAQVLAAVDGLADRAAEVVALRAEKGKTISTESADLLRDIESRCERLKELIAEPIEETPQTSDDELAREFARFVAISQGVTS